MVSIATMERALNPFGLLPSYTTQEGIKRLNDVENNLNALMAIPIVGDVSSICKFLLGYLQVIHALVIGTLSTFGPYGESGGYYGKVTTDLLIHGFLNILGGLIRGSGGEYTLEWIAIAIGAGHLNRNKSHMFLAVPREVIQAPPEVLNYRRSLLSQQQQGNEPAAQAAPQVPQQQRQQHPVVFLPTAECAFWYAFGLTIGNQIRNHPV